MVKVVSWPRRGLWLIMVIVLLPALVLVGVRSWSKNRSDIALVCESHVADSQGVLAEQVKLDLVVRNNEAELIYSMHQDNVELGAVKLSGQLIRWCAAELSYQLSFEKGQVLLDFGRTQLPEALEQTVMLGREPLSKGQPILVRLRLLELEQDRALVVVDESHSLWSCSVNNRGSW